MATKAKGTTNEDRRQAARMMADGTVCSALTTNTLPGVGGGAADVHDLRACIAEMAKHVADGDLSDLEKMLLSQGVALQAMFANLALKAQAQTMRDNLQVMTSLALKAAAGSRQALVALAELRMPKQVMFTKQANINNGGQQQVNNGPAPAGNSQPVARAEESAEATTGLLEAQHGKWLDTGAAGTAGRVDPHLAPVGAVHRPAQR